MTKYKVGDKVRIKKGLIHENYYGGVQYIDAMYYSHPVTIRKVCDGPIISFYYIAECPYNWLYSSVMFEDVVIPTSIFENDNDVDKKLHLKVNKNSKYVQFNFNN